MKMYQILKISNLYDSIKDKKLPLKIAYKFSKLVKKAEEESSFYQQKFSEIVNEYAQKDEEGNFIYLEDGNSIAIAKGKENECHVKIDELENLEIENLEITFTFEELESLDLNLSVEELDCLMPLIKE